MPRRRISGAPVEWVGVRTGRRVRAGEGRLSAGRGCGPARLPRLWCRRVLVVTGCGPADRAQCRQSVALGGFLLTARRRRRLLVRREPAAPAAGSAVVGRRGGRSVHGVPRLEHLSVGLRTSPIGMCLLPPRTACFLRRWPRPMRPYSTRIHAPYGQVRRECDIGRSALTAASHRARMPGRITENAGLRSLRPIRLRCLVRGPTRGGAHRTRSSPDENRSRPYRAPLRTQVPLGPP